MASKNNSNKEVIIIVSLYDYENPFVFGSLSAIFDKFSKEEIGISLRELYEASLKVGDSIKTDNGIIFKTTIYRKSQNK